MLEWLWQLEAPQQFGVLFVLGLVSLVLFIVLLRVLWRVGVLFRLAVWFAGLPPVKRAKQWLRERPETPLLVVGVLCLLVVAAWLHGSMRLLSEGRSAVGEVISLVESSSYDSSEKRTVTRVTATIRFEAGRQVVHFRRSWDKGGGICIAGCYAKGERLNLLYLPEDPEAAVVNSPFGLFGGPVIVGLVGSMFLFAWWVSRRSRRASDPAISGPAVL